MNKTYIFVKRGQYAKTLKKIKKKKRKMKCLNWSSLDCIFKKKKKEKRKKEKEKKIRDMFWISMTISYFISNSNVVVI